MFSVANRTTCFLLFVFMSTVVTCQLMAHPPTAHINSTHVCVITSPTKSNKVMLVNRKYSSSSSHIFDTLPHKDSVNNNKYNFPSSKQKRGLQGKRGSFAWGFSAHVFSVL